MSIASDILNRVNINESEFRELTYTQVSNMGYNPGMENYLYNGSLHSAEADDVAQVSILVRKEDIDYDSTDVEVYIDQEVGDHIEYYTSFNNLDTAMNAANSIIKTMEDINSNHPMNPVSLFDGFLVENGFERDGDEPFDDEEEY